MVQLLHGLPVLPLKHVFVSLHQPHPEFATQVSQAVWVVQLGQHCSW